MNPPKNRLQHQPEEELAATHHTTAQQNTQTFATPEELLRHDARNTPLPSRVTERVRQSLAVEPRPSWWRRLIGR